MNHSKVLQAMIEFDHGDAKRIQHFIKVHDFASLIGTLENLPPQQQAILEVAAILHDIGIHPAEAKYNSSAGKYQEIEGPAPAKTILTKLGDYDTAFIDRVCWLIAHHHTYGLHDELDYHILLEADFLVNAFEDELSSEAITNFRDKVFVTASGKQLLNTMFDLA